jgi:hypothetical protein
MQAAAVFSKVLSKVSNNIGKSYLDVIFGEVCYFEFV